MTRSHADPHVALLDDARQAEAVADRSRRRLLAEADDQDATFRGSLEDLAEGGSEVVLETIADRAVAGRVRALAADHVLLGSDQGLAWIRLAAVTLLRVPRGAAVRAGGGERAARPDLPLADALRPLAEQRAEVEVVFEGGALVRGVVLAVGRDVLTVRTPTSDTCVVHLHRVVCVLARPG